MRKPAKLVLNVCKHVHSTATMILILYCLMYYYILLDVLKLVFLNFEWETQNIFPTVAVLVVTTILRRTFTFNTTQWVQRIISGKKTKQNRILDPIYEFMIKYMNFIFNVIKCISTKASWYPCRSVGHIKKLTYL